MALKVKATHSNYADGTELAFGNFFLAKVGEEVIVDDDACDRYKAFTGNDLKDSLPKGWTAVNATKAEAESVAPVEPEVTTTEDKEVRTV